MKVGINLPSQFLAGVVGGMDEIMARAMDLPMLTAALHDL